MCAAVTKTLSPSFASSREGPEPGPRGTTTSPGASRDGIAKFWPPLVSSTSATIHTGAVRRCDS